MEPFQFHTGLVAPFDRANVDTDLIIPKQFLKSIERTGFGENLFDQLRYHDEGQPGMDNAARPRNNDFILHQPRYQGASILLTREFRLWFVQGTCTPGPFRVWFSGAYRAFLCRYIL